MALVLSWACVCGCVPGNAAPYLYSDAVASDAYSQAMSYLPEDGIYRIRSVSAGRYLSSSENGWGLTLFSESSEQIFAVSVQNDGSILLVSGGGKAYLATGCEETEDGDIPTDSLTVQDSPDARSRFSVLRLDDGAYLLSPLFASAPTFALGADASDTVALSEYSAADSQRWFFEPVPIASISLSRDALSMMAGSSTSLDVIMFPAKIDGDVVWSSDNPAVASVDQYGKVIAYRDGSATITAVLNDLQAECLVTVSNIQASAYFSQHNFSDGGWNVMPLTSLRFSGRLFAIERYNRGADWLDEGCLLCCYSMLLKNLGAVMTNGYDFRSGKTDSLDPDPYITALANSGNYGATSAKANLYGNPISISLSMILSRFTVNGAQITASSHRGGVTLRSIRDELAQHPEGIIVEFYRSSTLRHFLVFTECINPDDPNGNYKFIVCDSAAFDRNMGDHVLFEDSISYRNIGYRFSNAVGIRLLNVRSGTGDDGYLVESVRGNPIFDARVK